MVLALQWLLTIVSLFAGLIAKRICQRYGIPQLPWRTPWIALLAHTTEQTIETLRIPISAGLDLSIVTGILTSIAISRFLVWMVLEILPRWICHLVQNPARSDFHCREHVPDRSNLKEQPASTWLAW